MEPKEITPEEKVDEVFEQEQFQVKDDRFYYETDDGKKVYWEYDADGNRIE